MGKLKMLGQFSTYTMTTGGQIAAALVFVGLLLLAKNLSKKGGRHYRSNKS